MSAQTGRHAAAVRRPASRSASRRRRKVRYARVDPAQPNLVPREVDYIVAQAAASDAQVVTLGQLLVFSTQTGDAWLLDPEDHLARRKVAAASPSRLSKPRLASPSNGMPRTASKATLSS